MITNKCNIYICKHAFFISLSFKFSSSWFYFLLKCTKERRKKPSGKNLSVYRQFFKYVICIFLMLLCVTYLQRVGAAPSFRKNCNPFPLFLFINTPSQIIKWRILYIPPTPLIILLPAHPILLWLTTSSLGKVNSSIQV